MTDVIDLTSPSPVHHRGTLGVPTSSRTGSSRNPIASSAAPAPATTHTARPHIPATGRRRVIPSASPASLDDPDLDDSDSEDSDLEDSGLSSHGLFLSEEESDEYDEDEGDELNYEDYLNATTEESDSEGNSDDAEPRFMFLPAPGGSNTRQIAASAPTRSALPQNPRPRSILQHQTIPQQSHLPSQLPTHKPSTMSLKRSRTPSEVTKGANTPATKKSKVDPQVIDMVDVEDDADVQKLMQEQMIKTQREEGAARRKIADFTCVICLDEPINLSATTCGHLFCNDCIKTTLRFGKPNTKHGKCPVCRGKVVIKEIVPLELKLVKKLAGKGKGKA